MNLGQFSTLLAASLLSACATPTSSVVTVYAPFDEAQAKALLQPGTNTVRGNAFVRQRGGGVVTCAGSQVTLVPATTYASERMRYIYSDQNVTLPERARAPLSDQRVFSPDFGSYRQNVKTTVCDSQGNFTFDRVADGRFFVVTTVAWQVGSANEGARLMHQVLTSNGQTISVVLSG